jgi:hypothetical protein
MSDDSYRVVTNQHVWAVRLTIPRDKPGGWTSNVGVSVLCETADRAIVLALRKHPTARVWSVNHAANQGEMLVDAAFLSALAD